MELIASFSVDHTKIIPGIFVSREDIIGNNKITTYDIRLIRPNAEPAIDVAAMHSLEHIIATFLRNDPDWKDEVIYWGPMGCLTGFYLILKGNRSPQDIYELLLNAFRSQQKTAEIISCIISRWLNGMRQDSQNISAPTTEIPKSLSIPERSVL